MCILRGIPIAKADSRSLATALRLRGKVNPIVVSQLDQVCDTLMPLVSDGDVVITQGAGDVGRLPGILTQGKA